MSKIQHEDINHPSVESVVIYRYAQATVLSNSHLIKMRSDKLQTVDHTARIHVKVLKLSDCKSVKLFRHIRSLCFHIVYLQLEKILYNDEYHDDVVHRYNLNLCIHTLFANQTLNSFLCASPTLGRPSNNMRSQYSLFFKIFISFENHYEKLLIKSKLRHVIINFGTLGQNVPICISLDFSSNWVGFIFP